MRSLKFRIWGIERECYLDESELAGITPDGKYILYIEEDGISRLEIEENFIIEQYTGIKDKNGKMIYEGDIVRGYYDGKWMWKAKFAVAWDELSACYVLTKNGDAEDADFVLGGNHWKYRVIGNVHEDEELLDD